MCLLPLRYSYSKTADIGRIVFREMRWLWIIELTHRSICSDCFRLSSTRINPKIFREAFTVESTAFLQKARRDLST